MEQKTRDHSEVAERNRQFAVWILHPAPDRPDQSNAWGVVAAFYAAVHIVNAYLWESDRIESRNHHHRARYLDRDPLLISVRREYRQLASLGWTARYDPTAHLSFHDLQAAVEYLDRIMDVVFAEIHHENE